MSIAKNIKMLRDRYDLSQQDLADIAGVTNKAVSSWETGVKEPRMGAIEKIVAKFNLKKSNLIEENGMEIAFVKKEGKKESITEDILALIRKYDSLDEKGKHTVNTVLNMEFERCTKPHLQVVAAHNDDYSDEQLKLMQIDIDEL